jgi:tetratricopeptide (TPR) repeat protein
LRLVTHDDHEFGVFAGLFTLRIHRRVDVIFSRHLDGCSDCSNLPANAKGATARAPCFFEFAQPDKQIAACTALIRSAVAGITAALLSRAGAFGQKGDYQHAVEDATQVIALAPSPVAYYTRALAYHDDGDDMRAIADCEAALGMQPDNANALFVRGAAYQGLAAYSEAIRDFTKVLKLDPKRVDARFREAPHAIARDNMKVR